MYMSKKPLDLTVIYYTSNWLEEHNPFFVENTKRHLLRAIGEHPLISVSHKPMDFGQNIVFQAKGRSHLNIYRQILEGCKAAKTDYVAMAEDDILYSYEHFHTYVPKEDKFAYDMNKWSIFTWTKPPMFSFRNNRMVVNQLIAKREMLIDAMEERFAKFKNIPDEKIPIKFWGDPGRYENKLGVTIRQTEQFFCRKPSIVFSHEEAFGYLNHGKKKMLGDMQAIELFKIGRAEDILKLYYKDYPNA